MVYSISIMSLHEHFQKDRFVLLYEISHKVCADIHTKAYKRLSNTSRLAPGFEFSRAIADTVSPSVDHKKIDHQIFQTRTDAQTPALPRAVFVKGMTGREGRRPRPSECGLYLRRRGSCLLSSLSTRTISRQQWPAEWPWRAWVYVWPKPPGLPGVLWSCFVGCLVCPW